MISTPWHPLGHLRASAWLRWSYWWYYAAIGCLLPYIALYYQHLGFSGFQIGVLTTTIPLGTAFCAPLWGTLADTFAAHRIVLRSALLLAVGMAILLTQLSQFVTLLLVMTLLAITVAAIPSLLDGYAMTISEHEGQSYGHLRVWGSAGFVVTAWLVGWWMDNSISNLFLVAYTVALLLSGVATFGLPQLQPRRGEPMWQGVTAIMQDRPVLLLLFNVYLSSSSASILLSFLGIYIVEIGGNVQLVGGATAIGAISELPVFVLGTRLLNRLNSRRVLMFAMIVYVVRYTLYGIPLAPIWIAWVQWLHGLSYAAFLMASVTLIHELVGPARAATAQGLLTSMSLGFGAITGTLVGGLLLDYIGAVGIFRVAGAGMLVACVSYRCSMRVIRPT